MNLQILATTLAKKVGRMRNPKFFGVFFLIVAFCPASFAQIACGPSAAARNKLACLISTEATPPGYSFTSQSSQSTAGKFASSFAFLTEDMGGEMSQIPLPSPASGIIFTTDPTLHVPVPSGQSMGPILAQRADTIGRHKFYVASTYQYFLLEDVDGLSLKSLPSTFLYTLNTPPEGGGTVAPTVGIANGRIDLKIHQYVGYATFGLTDHLDVSVAIPVLRVDMRYTVSELFFSSSDGSKVNVSLPTPSKAEEATGIGDVVLAFKEQAWKGKHFGLAFGAEARLPTGDAENFLGSGTFGIKPFVTLSRSGKISPHLNVGYQFNGNTELVTDSTGTRKAQLPDRLLYSGGADWGISKRMTIAADVLEQRLFDATQATLATEAFVNTNSGQVLSRPTIETGRNSYNRTDGSIGFKLKPFGNLLLTTNLLVKLDRNGLRQRMAPLMGLSLTF